ncbi:MAG: HNH endonuclease, partial [Actinomycetes bacterium]
HLHASTMLDGLVKIDALLPADMGQQFLALMESAHRAVKRTSLGDPVGDQPRDRRPASTRNLESFQRLMDAAASLDAADPAGLPPIQGARPVIHAAISVETLMNDTERAAGFLHRLGMRSPVLSTITTATAIDRMLCDGVVNPYLVNTQGHLVASLPAIRTVPPHVRKAIHIRDQHCRFTGCTSRIDEAHHITFARHGGQTEMTNLIGLCWHHHHLIHHKPWTLTGNANHNVVITNTLTNQNWRSPPRINRE